jgi:hypothetical protein
MAKQKQETVFNPKGVKKLLRGGGKKLTDEERALIVAMAEVEAANLSEDEREAVEKLRDQVEDYDPDELSRAVEHMMSAKAKKGRKLKWPELKRRPSRRRKTKASSSKKKKA